MSFGSCIRNTQQSYEALEDASLLLDSLLLESLLEAELSDEESLLDSVSSLEELSDEEELLEDSSLELPEELESAWAKLKGVSENKDIAVKIVQFKKKRVTILIDSILHIKP